MQQDALWRTVLGEIELTVTRPNYITWFMNTCLLEQTDEEIVIGVPNVFIKQQFEKKYNSIVASILKNNGVEPQTITYKISAQASSSAKKPVAKTPKEEATEQIVRIPSKSESKPATTSNPLAKSGLSHSYRQGLNDKYSFDNFIVGASNELAFAACQAIAQQPGLRYNPLFLYGGVGIGKTHLIQAVGNQVLADRPNAKVLYITTEQFVQEFVDALKFRKTADFSAHYRNADVLIVDDIQFIAGKEKMQEEFFHTFNALHQANRQIIISSDKPPGEIPTLEDRLKSRLAGGMSIDMHIPDFETRCAIIQTKAQNHGIVLEADIVEHLATNFQTNIRELEGVLNQLLAFCEMRGLEPTLAIATSLLGVSKGRPKHLSAKQIIERTARHFQIPIEDITGPKRDKDIVVPRQVAMYLLRDELHLSFPIIARELGRKDHTTAMHSVEKIDKESRLDATLRASIMHIKEQLHA